MVPEGGRARKARVEKELSEYRNELAQIERVFSLLSAGGHQRQVVLFQKSVRAEGQDLRSVYCPEQVKAYGMAALAADREPRVTYQSG